MIKRGITNIYPKQIDLSISLITYKNKELLENCLNSILKNTKNLSFEILLVDNGSCDQTSKMVKKKFPQVDLIANKQNLLFIKAHNQNLTKVRGRYFLVLNEDTQIPPKAINKMVKFMDQSSKVGLASCRQVDEKGATDTTCSLFPTPLIDIFETTFIGKSIQKLLKIKTINKMLAKYRYHGWDRKSIKEVDVIPGSFFLGRSELLKKVGLFDEKLLFFYVEPDYCFRVKKIGYKVVHNGKITILHLKAKGLGKLTSFRRYQISQYCMLAYYKKYFGLFWWLILWLLMRPNWLYFMVLRTKG